VILCIVVAIVSGCATEPDTRPETLDYIVEAILAPYCGRGGCHSSVTRVRGLAFDTIDGALAAMKTTQRGEQLVVPHSPMDSRLVNVLSDQRRIMPPDVPLPQKDIDLITRWVADGAEGFQ
jgi:Planctomycete cytochrome C